MALASGFRVSFLVNVIMLVKIIYIYILDEINYICVKSRERSLYSFFSMYVLITL